MSLDTNKKKITKIKGAKEIKNMLSYTPTFHNLSPDIEHFLVEATALYGTAPRPTDTRARRHLRAGWVGASLKNHESCLHRA